VKIIKNPLFRSGTKNQVSSIANGAALTSINDSSGHYYVLDQANLLTDLAQESIKTIVNTPNTILVMTTNHLNEVDKGIINRSILIERNAADPSLWLPCARRVMADNNVIAPSDSTVENLIRPCNGSAREIVDRLLRVIARARPK
jgi:hypothetical protein